MLSSSSQWLCFVDDSGKEGKAELECALDGVRQHNIPFRVVDESSLSTMSDGDAVYVLKAFDTETHRLLRKKGRRIVGPMCVVTTLQERSALPESRQSNVFTLAMRGAVVCCTNVGERNERDMLYSLVMLMGGSVQRSLTQSVTHLLAGEVGSAKYNVAHDLKIPILLPSWVEEAWRISQSKPLNALEPEFMATHRCPVFKGCSLCVTGIDANVRKEIQRLTEENGGQYGGELNMETTTHLVAEKAAGEKYKHARLWGIPCVTSAWFFKSLEHGGCENVKSYEVEAGSTEPLAVPGQAVTGNGEHADASRKRKRATDAQDNPPTKRTLLPRNSSNAILSTEIPAQYTDLVVKESCNAYLDGCKILLHGFDGAMLEVLRRIINCGGGTRFSQLNATVSHIILDHPNSELQKRLEEIQGVRPHVVSSVWLLESCRLDRRLPEDQFPCSGMQLKEKPMEIDADCAKPLSSMPPPDPLPSTKPAQKELDSGNILAHYTSLPPPASSAPEPSASSVTTQAHTPAGVCAALGSADQTAVASASISGGLFSSLSFWLATQDPVCNTLAAKVVRKACGQLVTEPSPECYVVACLSALQRKDLRQVTLFWLEKCVSSGKLLALTSDPLFQPCGFKSSAAVLSGKVLSLSQYEGQLRSQLSKLASSMGATVQDHFVRKPSKGLKASTHLLCQSAAGSKYAAAQRWSLPAVSHLWLIACCQQQAAVPECGHIVDQAAVPSPVVVAGTPCEKTQSVGLADAVRTGLTPKFLQTSAGASPQLDPPGASKAHSFLPKFDTADAEAALQSPAVIAARKRNRSSGVPLEEMFQNNLASAVGICSVARVTENESTAVEKTSCAQMPLAADDKTPVAASGRRPVRRGKRHMKMSLEGVSVQPAPNSQHSTVRQPVADAGATPKRRSVAGQKTKMASPTSATEQSPVKAQPEESPENKTPAAPEIPATGTLEVREAFEREMEELMALTSSRNSNGRTSVRRSSRLSRNSGRGSPPKGKNSSSSAAGSPTSGSGVAAPPGGSLLTSLTSYSKLSSSSSAPANTTDLDQANSDSLNGGELSQSEMITYDDPNGRLERERIIAELKEAPVVNTDFPVPDKSDIPPPSCVLSPKREPQEDEVSAAAVSASSATPTPPVPVPMIAALRPTAKTRPPLAMEDLTVSQTQSRAAQLKFHLTALSQAVSYPGV